MHGMDVRFDVAAGVGIVMPALVRIGDHSSVQVAAIEICDLGRPVTG